MRAIAFDALAVFNTASVVARCEEAFPARSAQLASTWRARQFGYTWLRVSPASRTSTSGTSGRTRS
jgi:hypothetical protein